MSAWAARLGTAVAQWRQGDRHGAAAALREIVVAADAAVVAEASHVLGLVPAESGDRDGARAAHRSVVAGGPQWAQRSAIVLGTLLMDEGRAASAWRPLRIAASGADELAYWIGDQDAAVRFYELCLAMGTDDAELVGESAYRAGEIRFARGDLPAATALLGRAVESGDEEFAGRARVLLAKLG